LKILEAMSLGSPVVSTSVGAEGIEYVDGKHLVIADEPKMFAEAVFSLLNNQETFNEVRANALKLVKEKYDWKIIGKQLNEAIDVLFDSKKEVTTHA
jgi:glycosyltransferase involved in cell wall biosynthesis